MAEYGKIVILHLVQVEGLVVGVVLDDCVAALPVFSNRKRKTLPHLATPPLSLDFIQQAETKNMKNPNLFNIQMVELGPEFEWF